MSEAPRSVIVTGGTGALGRALVRRFLSGGDRVVVPWIVEAERAVLAETERDALARDRLVLLRADVTSEAGALEVARAAGDPCVLVCAVGGFAGGTPVHETPLATFEAMYRLNLISAVAASRAVLPGMIARRAGTIVCVASRAAIELPGGLAAYACAKAALVAFVGTLQKEVGTTGVRVHAVVPTTLDTPANRAAMPDADFTAWTPPARIADAVHWLASDAASSVRGALLPV